jgi:stage V sporulation protein B
MAYRKKGIVAGALILTAASVFTRILGFIYRVYMSQTIGAEGMGLYQLVMPIYSLAWAIACSGFTMTISRLVSAENAKGEYGNMGRVLKQCLVITTAVAAVLSAAAFSAADPIANYLLGDGRVTLSLRILAFAFPFMAAGSCVRGYYLGMQESTVPAVSQVLEQVVHMSVIYALAGAFIPMGMEYACAAAVIGIALGEFISFVYVMFSYVAFKRGNKFTKRPSMAPRAVLDMILAMAMPLTLTRVTGSLLTTVENLLIPQRLQMYGLAQAESIALYGKITGMALPLIFFPSAILYALATTLVPDISAASAKNDKARVKYTVNKAMLFTSVIGIGAAAVFIVFADQLGLTIYKQDISSLLIPLGVMCPLWYLSITFSGVLNGMGRQVFMFKNSLAASAINIAFIFFIVPRFGLNAFIAGWMLSLVVSVTAEIVMVRISTGIDVQFLRWFAYPALAALAAALAARLAYTHIIGRFFAGYFALITGVALLGALFCGFVLLLGVIRIEDVAALFKGLPIRKLEQAAPKDKTVLG